ncbi:hypothetical protein GALMADRAFT_228165 [Galerina marginata CBS 339.88]|uniref:Uncharacterized protein n=1 Tax=Galerina marginata (strain CBS 339.88) TaxID=685588 RepID=A0A067SRX3_GALM3|nr:hypothetical protein GALMADRAFT_228165 [Galerina marginata CBS 339.88]
MDGCSKAPGDPASSPLNQREKQSAKIVFETALAYASSSPPFVWTSPPSTTYVACLQEKAEEG